MVLIVITMKILAVLLPISVLCMTSFLPEQYYKIQKTIFKKLIPRSPNDKVKLLFAGIVGSFSLWCILYFLFSLLESILRVL